MKNNLAFLVLLVICTATFSQKATNNQYVVNGSTENKSVIGKTVYLTVYTNEGKTQTDSTTILQNGTFVFKGSVQSPCLAQIRKNHSDDEAWINFRFYLENSNIAIILKDEIIHSIPYLKPTITGSKSDSDFRRECSSCIQENVGTVTWEGPTLEYVETNPCSIFAPFLYYEILFKYADYKTFSKQMDKFCGEARNTYHYKLLQKKKEMKKHISVGSKIPHFALPDSAGKKVDVYEFAKGKRYVIVTFWASWCGPCRKEFRDEFIPLYNEYHDKGLDILSVSVDDNREKWIAAQTAEKLPWTDVCELAPTNKSVAHKSFGIKSVPYSLLIDGNGKIIAHGGNMAGMVKFYFATNK